MTDRSRRVGEIIREIGYEILGGQTIYSDSENLDLIGVLMRQPKKKRSMDKPGTFYGIKLALVRAHSDPVIVEVFEKRFMKRMQAMKAKMSAAGMDVRLDYVGDDIEKTTGPKAQELRFE